MVRSRGGRIDGVDWFCSNLRIIHIFDLFFHLFLRHNKFRLSAIILLLFNGVYKTYEYYFIYLGYEGKYLTENTYESVPTAGDLVLLLR